MSDLKIDGHKLIYHIDRVARWLKGEEIYPIYVEVSPFGGCNHRCKFCALDYLGYEPEFLKTDLFLDILTEMGELGVKSIMYAGEGEPLLHRDINKIISHTKKVGIDVAITTNGVLLNKFFKTKNIIIFFNIIIDVGDQNE